MTLDELQKFCAGKDDIRIKLRAPFTQGEWTYATDHHIIVRMPVIAGVATLENPKNLTSMFAREFNNWVPVPKVEIRVGAHYVCEKCDHAGMSDPYTWEHKTMIGDTCFQDRYLALIQGWEISPDPDDPLGVAGIRGEGVRGLLMPHRKD